MAVQLDKNAIQSEPESLSESEGSVSLGIRIHQKTNGQPSNIDVVTRTEVTLPSLNLGSEVQVARDIFQHASDDIAGEDMDEKERAFRSRSNTRGPSEASWWSSSQDKPVSIRYGDRGAAKEPAITVTAMFEDVVRSYGDNIALAVKRMGEWHTWTYKTYQEQSRQVAKAFIYLGLQPHHSVCILGFNSPEWLITNMATIMARGQTVGIYLTSTPEACCTVAASSRANIIVVENDYQLNKILQVRDRLPEVKAIVQYSKHLQQRQPGLYEWRDLFELGGESEEEKLERRLAATRPNQCCAIIYTSGTSGSPKGVLLSHDNLTWMCKRVVSYVQCQMGEEHVISYLPLSHIASQLLDIYSVIGVAGTCWFAQPDALKGSLLQTMQEVRPTMFLGVPRVWDKIAESMLMRLRTVRGFKGKLLSWARGIGLKANASKQSGNSLVPFGWSLANLICFKKIRQNLGLDRCHFQMTGAAPSNEDTLAFFMSVNLPLYEMYGMSETTGPTTVTTTDHVRYLSVGRPYEGATVEIDNPGEDGMGEVLISGRHVFMGYNGLPELTRDVFTQDGFLRSGDIGYMHDGYVYITGRKKELLITAGGEKVAPVPIENLIKQMLPIVSNAVVVGDQQKFLSCLLTLRVEVDEATGLPTNQLSAVSVEACQKVGSSALTVGDILSKGSDHKVLRMIQKGIDKVNNKAPSKVQKIAKWSILERDFSVAGGELTPTQKLKRSIIMFKYLESIESFYS